MVVVLLGRVFIRYVNLWLLWSDLCGNIFCLIRTCHCKISCEL